MTLPLHTSRVAARASLADLNPGNALLTAYLRGDDAVRPFFSHRWADTTAGDSLPHARQADPAQLSAALVNFQQALGADDAAVTHARLLADPTIAVITVGQQPGLLTGPLYTLYKALTAIALAQQCARERGRPVVPVFWVATDDDDRAEVDHCTVRDRQGALHTLSYPADAGMPGQLVGEIPTVGYGEQVLEQLATALDGLPHAAAALALCRETLRDARDFGDWCCRLLARVCSPLGLVICDPRLPALRRLSAEVLRREMAAPLATTAAVNGQAHALRQVGFRGVLHKPADVCNFFVIDGIRHRVTFADGVFQADRRPCTPEAMTALLATHPECFAPNAVLRPVVQEYFFGSATFVAGPHELCYWAELRPVFDALQVAMPAVAPRAGATLLTPHEARELDRLVIPPQELLRNFDAVRFAQLAQHCPPDVLQTFSKRRAELEVLCADLANAAGAVDTTLAATALAAHQRMVHEFDRLEKKTLKAVERSSEEITRRIARLRDALFPGHGLQERALALPWAIARFGVDLPQQLLSLLAEQEGQHLFVEME